MVAAVLGCGGAEEQGIDRDRFVRAYLDLREATLAAPFDSTTRDSILAEHDVTADEMRAFISAHVNDPDAIARAWQDVMDSAAARDTTADPAANDTL